MKVFAQQLVAEVVWLAVDDRVQLVALMGLIQ